MAVRYLVVINPKAGRVKVQKIQRIIDDFLSAQQVCYELIVTERAGQMKSLLHQHWDNADVIVAVGGDGTINEVVNGLCDFSKPLGIIPVGSGNDFVRSCGIPVNDIEFALRVLLRNQQQQVDVGVVNGRRFINAVGIGYDGYVNALAQKVKWLRGGLKYSLSILIGFVAYREITLRFETEMGLFNARVFMLGVNNGRYVGNGLLIAPDAMLTDAKFDAVLIKAAPRWRLIAKFYKVLQGKIKSQPEVESFQLSQLQVVSDEDIPVHCDGEQLRAAKELTLSVMPSVLTVIGGWKS